MLSNIFGKKKTFEELKKLGDEQFDKNNHSEAIKFYQQALELRPNEPYIINDIGAAYTFLKDWKRAYEYFKRAAELSPNDPVLQNNLGKAYYEFQDYKNAVVYFEKAIKLDSSKPSFYNQLGNAYYGLNQYEKALANYRQANKLDPKEQVFKDNMKLAQDKLGDYEEEVFDPDENVERAKALVVSGDKYFDKENYNKAIELYKQAIELDDKNAIAFNNIGASLSWLGNKKEAIKYYKRALEIEPHSAFYHNNISTIYRTLENYDEAIYHGERAVELEPKNKKYKDNLEAAIQEKEDFENGLSDTESENLDNDIDTETDINESETETSNSEIDRYLDLAIKDFDNKRYESAIKNYKKIIAINPKDAATYNSIGNCLTWIDNWEEAQEYYEKAVKYDPKDAIYLTNLANCHISFGRNDEAKELLIKSVKIDPKDSRANNYLGKIYKDEKDYDNAEKYLKKAVENDTSNDIQYMIDLANNYVLAKKYNEAIKVLDEAAEIDSYNELVVANYGHAYYGLKDYKKANSFYKQLNSIVKDDPSYMAFYSSTLRLTGDIEKAEEIINKAYEIDSSDSNVEEEMREVKIVLDNKKIGVDSNKDTSSSQPVEVSLDTVMTDLNKLTGIQNIKDDIKKLINFIKVEKHRKEIGISKVPLTLHSVFLGSPGTGKTTVARLMGKIFFSLGLLKKGHLVEVTRADLVAEAWGQTGTKVNKVVKSAIDGVLFIDEAYTLKQSDDDVFGQDAIDTILKLMEDNKEKLVVIVAGYTNEMDVFINSNPGLKDRFTRKFTFMDYKPEELMQIFAKASSEFVLTDAAKEKLQRFFNFAYSSRDKTFGNARFAVNLFQKITQVQSDRLAKLDLIKFSKTDKTDVLTKVELEDIEAAVSGEFIDVKEETLDNVLNELKNLVGLDSIKKDLEKFVKFVKVEQIKKEKGLSTNPISMHTVFLGSPGTGKTTVARLLGKIYFHLGILSKGHVVEVDRSDLVGTAWGKTGEKTMKVIEKAMGGVLFIDEAYTLNQSEDDVFGQDALDTILKQMDDKRDKFMVVIAGYTDEINQLIKTNPGLQSRFNRYFNFEDYKPEILLEIFKSQCTVPKVKKSYTITPEAEQLILKFFTHAYNNKDKSFGNGRFVRNFHEKVLQAIPQRITDLDNITDEDLLTITAQDVESIIKLDLEKLDPPKEKDKNFGFTVK